MDHSLLIATQTQRTLQRRLEVAANNLANANTTGFKADAVKLEQHTPDGSLARDRPRDIVFVRDAGMLRDMRQGPIARTGEPYDVALEGEGFFAVQGPDGRTLYTRDGSFRPGPNGQLVTRDGYPVLGQGGPIAFDPQGERPSIDADGTIQLAGVAAGQLRTVAFADPGRLEKIGDNLFAAPADAPGLPATAAVVQGALEGSNVRPITELTEVMQISRAYESASRIVRQTDELRQRAIERLGRAG